MRVIQMIEPTGLGERGSRLFRALTKDEDNPLVIEASIEAARAADRLDDLDRAIQGEGVLDLMRVALEDNGVYGDEHNVAIKLDFKGVLMEGRQQQDNFRKLLGEVNRMKNASAQTETQSNKAEPVKQDATANPLIDDELAQRRKAREALRSG